MDNHVDPSGGILSQERLSHVSRHIKTLVPSTSDENVLKELRSVCKNVIQSAATPSINITHRVAAWNTLCALIDQTTSSSDAAIAKLVFETGYWTRSFDLYLSHSYLTKPKSSRQLLTSLTTALTKGTVVDPSVIYHIKQTSVRSLIQDLKRSDDHGRTKASAAFLAHFLRKNVVSLDAILQWFDSEARADSGNMTVSSLQTFLSVLFRWIGNGDFASTICHLVTTVLDRSASYPGGDTSRDDPVWMEPLQKLCKSTVMDLAEMRAHLLPMLFKRSLHEYSAFLSNLNFDTSAAGPNIVGNAYEELLFASLLTGKDIGFIVETAELYVSRDEYAIHVPVGLIANLLSHISRSARLTGLALLIVSPLATRPVVPAAFKLLRQHLHHFLADTDSNFRSEVFSLAQRLVDRIRSATAALARQAKREEAPAGTTAQNMLLSHKNFLEWLVRALQWDLRPTASYQRHISALKVLSILARSGLDESISSTYLSKAALGETKWPIHIPVLTKDARCLLLDLLTDPFDDVRQMSASILGLMASNEGDAKELETALVRAEMGMLASGRADQADGVAHIYTLLHKARPSSSPNVLYILTRQLEDMLEIGRSDLSRAVSKYPVHGLLTSIRYILTIDSTCLTHDPGTRFRLVACLHLVWIVVKPILCDDAPEGYLPESMEEDQQGFTTKDTLSYCWRALKEASLLLGTLVSMKPAAQEIEDLAQLCFTQLAELRHRGAFSTVAQTWATCCLKSASLRSSSGTSVMQEWYEKVLHILRNKTLINTRRSAGLPSLLCGILAADGSGIIMSKAFTEFEGIARETVDPSLTQEGSLPQVHAMNCLKDVLKNTKLGEQSEAYIPKALRLAADALRSEAWAVRNCGLMLFRGVIDRLLGTSHAHLEDDVRSSQRVSVDQYPSLFGIVLDLLEAPSLGSAQSTRSEGVFPALQLLQRLHIPVERLSQVKESVLALTGSPVWHVRDKAARTYASMLRPDVIGPELLLLLSVDVASQNVLHGALLCAKYLVIRLQNTAIWGEDGGGAASRPNPPLISQDILHALNNAAPRYRDNTCPITTAAFLDVLAEADLSGGDYSRIAEATQSPKFSVAPHEDAAMRVAVARSLAKELLCTDAAMTTNPQKALLALATVDVDACIEFLKTLETSLRSEPYLDVLLGICVDLRGLASPHLMCEVRRTVLKIADLPDNSSFRHAVTSYDFASIVAEDETPQSADLLLQVRAACLEVRSSNANENDLVAWVDDCSAAVAATGLYSREAAALGISHFKDLWSFLAAGKHQHLLRQLSFAVYDLLNDDDEDIRLHAAAVAQKIMSHLTSAPNTNEAILVPAVASAELARLTLLTWPTAPDVANEVFFRAFDACSTSVADRLADFTNEDTALFAEEKQNLYLDPAREVRLWTQALLLLSPSSIPTPLINKLSHWIINGLTALITSEISSNAPEVFTLGLRVIHGAEMLLRWVEQRVRLPVRPSELRKGMVELLIRVEAGGNVLWMRELARVLSVAMRRRVGHVGKFVGWVEGALR